jgi:hypothetical protein
MAYHGSKIPMTIGNRYYRTACSRRRERRVRDHLFNWLDTRDRFLRKRESESHRAEQLAVYIDGTSTHPLQDSGLCEGSATQASQYDALLWGEIFEHSEDLDLKIFDAIVMEDSAAHATHSWPDILDTEEVL